MHHITNRAIWKRCCFRRSAWTLGTCSAFRSGCESARPHCAPSWRVCRTRRWPPGRDGRIVFANALAESLFGYEHDELIGQPVQILWPERVRDRYTRNMELYFATEHPLRFTIRADGLRRDGSEFVGEMSWGIVETEAGPLLLAIGRDMTAHREAMARLQRQSRQLAAVAALGERALSGADVCDLAEEAVERMRETLPLRHVVVHRTACRWPDGASTARARCASRSAPATWCSARSGVVGERRLRRRRGELPARRRERARDRDGRACAARSGCATRRSTIRSPGWPTARSAASG